MATYYNFLGVPPRGDVEEEKYSGVPRLERMMQEQRAGGKPAVGSPVNPRWVPQRANNELATERDRLWEKIEGSILKKVDKWAVGYSPVSGRTVNYKAKESNKRRLEALRQRMQSDPVSFISELKSYAEENPQFISGETQSNLTKLVETNQYLYEIAQRIEGGDPFVRKTEGELGDINRDIRRVESELGELEKRAPLIQVRTPDDVIKLREKRDALKRIREGKSAEANIRYGARADKVIRQYFPIQSDGTDQFVAVTKGRNENAKKSTLVPEILNKSEITVTPIEDPGTALVKELQNAGPAGEAALVEMAQLAGKSQARKLAMAGGEDAVGDEKLSAQARAAYADDDPVQTVKEILNRDNMKYQESVWFMAAAILAAGFEAAAKIFSRDTSGGSFVARFLQATFENQRNRRYKEADLMLRAGSARREAAGLELQRRRVALEGGRLQLYFQKEVREAKQAAEKLDRERGDKVASQFNEEFEQKVTNYNLAMRRIESLQKAMQRYEFTPPDDPSKVAVQNQLNEAQRYAKELLIEIDWFRNKLLSPGSELIESAEREKAEK